MDSETQAAISRLEQEINLLKMVNKGIDHITQGWDGECLTLRDLTVLGNALFNTLVAATMAATSSVTAPNIISTSDATVLGNLVVSGNILLTGTVNPAAYVATTLTAPWANYGLTYRNLGSFLILPNLVLTTGSIKSGGLGTGVLIGNVPVGYRPFKDVAFPVANAGNDAYVLVGTDGNITTGAFTTNALVTLTCLYTTF